MGVLIAKKITKNCYMLNVIWLLDEIRFIKKMDVRSKKFV